MEEIEYVFDTIIFYCGSKECIKEVKKEDYQWYHYCSTQCKELDE